MSLKSDLEPSLKLLWFPGVAVGVSIFMLGLAEFTGNSVLPPAYALFALTGGGLEAGFAFAKMVGWIK